ncbi:hypothetical protein SE19_07280 [Acidiplasma aeolicum]|uniref:Cobalamin biosynthesis precorrin-8X methylmutase CobH/CbiC domain-containing protein n=1 Tax=Acidiplasma aeolicum TaxID=507754 RepID=A0A0N8VL65_9ARCH|nr:MULTISPECIES: precorrin-8X methylmutase [Acidiplasma]KPV46041.1 hypothetical protein SE19_07280 [Acidiplasma aeolicum]KQB35660.1 hypothetical protein AOG54_02855 [Acidiplasma aeolicum]
MVYILNPEEIYSKSFGIIKNIMGLDDSLKSKIIIRAAHATGDIDAARSIIFSENFEDGLFDQNYNIVTDINMVKYGIGSNKTYCHINDDDVIESSKSMHISRSYIAIKKACREMPEAVYVIGDAPTALISIIEEINNKKCNPHMVIGVPVGFVSALESKQLLLKVKIPFITNLSIKGGSAMGAAIANAILSDKNVHRGHT